jgi:Pyruvate/2-oxoacid:ferredoxin oxidoreductase delta subunit
LKKAADSGLVHGISNQEEKPDTICNCDPTYCTMFRPYHLLGHDKSMDASNYKIKVTPETCKACAICVKRCPMDAIQLRVSADATNKFGKAVTVDTDLCVGCGVCAHKCPADSLVLEHREETTKPPKTGREWAQLFMSDLVAAEAKQE